MLYFLIRAFILSKLFLIINTKNIQTLDNSEDYDSFIHDTIDISNDIIKPNYIQLSTKCDSNDINSLHLYVSKTLKHSSFITSDYGSYTVQPSSIILPKDYYQYINLIYVTVAMKTTQPTQCKYRYKKLSEVKFEFNQSMLLPMNIYENKTISFDFSNRKYFYDNIPMVLYITSPSLQEFDVVLQAKDKLTNESRNITINQIYENGYGVLLENKKYCNSIIIITLIPYKNTIITIGNRPFSSVIHQGFKALDIIHGVLNNEDNLRVECFEFSSKKNSIYLLNIKVYRKNINHSFGPRKDLENIEIDQSMSYPVAIEPNIIYYLCMKRESELSPKLSLLSSGYSFQMIRLSKLSKSQMLIRPLVSGETINGYLSPNEIMVYRLDKQSDEDQSLTTKIIFKSKSRKKVDVYGSTCSSISSCQYDLKKLLKSKDDIIKANLLDYVSLISLQSPYVSNTNQFFHIAIVHCLATKHNYCLYQIMMQKEGDFSILTHEKHVYRTVTKDKTAKFIINIINEFISDVRIYLGTHTGYCELSLFHDKDMNMVHKVGYWIMYRNAEIVIFPYSPKNMKISHLYVLVKGISNSYFTLVHFQYSSPFQAHDIENNIVLESKSAAFNQSKLLMEGQVEITTFQSIDDIISFIYPYWFTGYKENLLISILATEKVEYSLSINSHEYSNRFINNDITQLIIPNYLLDQYCYFNNICPVRIRIQIKKPTQDKEWDSPLVGSKIFIQTTAINLIAVLLEKNTARLDYVFENTIQYYYYENIKNNQTGEIMVHFFRGSGYAIAKIVNETERDDNPNWKHRIRLPDIHEKNKLPYDYYQSKIIFTEEHTQKCEDYDLCSIYIAIISTEKESSLFSKFSLAFRSITVDEIIMINNYYYGSLEREEEHHYTFIFEEPKEIDTAIMEFNTKGCYMKISSALLKKSIFFTNTFKIYATLFNRTSLNNIYLEIKIGLYDNEPDYLSHRIYNFKLKPVIKEEKMNIVMLDFIQNEYCDIEYDYFEQYCRYVIKIHDYDYMRNYLLAVFPHNSQKQAYIYVTQMNEHQYNSLSRQELENVFPTPKKHYFASQNSVLQYNRALYKELHPTNYVLVTIASTVIGKIEFVSNLGHLPKSTLLIPDTRQLYFMNPNRRMELIIKGYDEYHCNILRLSGSGYVQKITKNIIYEKRIDQVIESANIFINTNDEDIMNEANIIRVYTKEEEPFGFAVIYFKRFDNISCDKAKVFHFSSFYYTEFKTKSHSFYTPVYDIKDDIGIIYYFDRDFPLFQAEQSKLNLTAFTTDREHCQKIQLSVYKIVIATINPFYNIGYLIISSAELSQPFMLLDNIQIISNIEVINKEDTLNNHFKLNYYAFQVRLSPGIPKHEYKALPNNTYIISHIDDIIKKHSYMIHINNSEGKYHFFEIEFISRNIDIGLTIDSFTNLANSNSKVIINNNIDQEGSWKKIIKTKLEPRHFAIELELHIRSDDNNNINASDKDKDKDDNTDKSIYVLKYITTSQPIKHLLINKLKPKLTYKPSINTSYISFTSIENHDHIIINANYTIAVYNASLYNSNLTKEEKALLYLTSMPMRLFKIEVKDNKSIVKYETTDIPLGKYYLSIIGKVNNDEYDEMIQYEVISFTLAKMSFSNYWLILMIVLGIIFISLIIYYCFFKSKKKIRKKEVIEESSDYTSSQYTDSIVST